MELPILIPVLFGTTVLLFGKKLFWLFVAITGAVTGLELGKVFFVGDATTSGYLFALGLALVGGYLAVYLQRMAFIFVGFIAGGYLSFVISTMSNYPVNPLMAGTIGACVGALLVAMFADRAIILISALVGAVTISNTFLLQPPQSYLAIFLLVALGWMFQTKRKRL